MSRVSIEALNFIYQGAHSRALKDIDLSIKSGEFVLLAGPSRAGKSTLCLTLNRLIPEQIKGQFSGKIIINGEDIRHKRVSEIGGIVGMVFQDYEAQLFSTRVDMEVAFSLENARFNRSEMKKRVKNMLNMVGLSGLESRNPATLSGGQKQRLAIASILTLEPDLLVLDEPLTDLDPAARRDMLGILLDMRKRGKTIILVEHDIEGVPEADSGLLIKDGRIEGHGNYTEVFNNPSRVKNLGIMPLATTELFERLGFVERPLKGEDAYNILKAKNKEIDMEIYRKLYESRLAEDTESVIEFSDVWFSYEDGIDVLKGINLSIKKGDFVAIVGQNGSGKTTLAKHINRLLEPTRGKVRIFGEEITKFTRAQIGQRVGYVFQNPDHQIFCETVYDEVAFAPRNFGLSENIVRTSAAEAIGAVGLKGYETADPFSLTRGERQKVAVASVLSASPEIIILDEPTTGLDYKERISTMEMLRRLNNEGRTIIIITHSMHIVAEYAKEVIAMKEGEVKFSGHVREFFSNETNLVQLQLSSPAIVRLGRHFGITVLSVEEMTRVIV